MARLTWFPPEIPRSALSLRSVFVWLLLALLVAGAASHTYGSRYAIVGHGTMQPASGQAAGLEGDEAAPPLPAASATSHDMPTPAAQVVHTVQQAVPLAAPESMERECCERRHAPRSGPAPLRTGAVDPPSLVHRVPGVCLRASVNPPEPDLPALSMVELSVSRT
ncbi:hypothetical protein [Paenarthrobacter sp. NEAU-H11]|uniref:hypothetical protein n=1 Tax=Paenarthrobacter sp. NEAU-H11 TaxID=3423924 RepID=UPI003D3539A0